MNQDSCENCLKQSHLCVCSELKPIATRLHLLILQHPQEPDHEIGSARIAHLSLPNSTLRVGLSWPNLKSALGKISSLPEPQASRWAVLYLGSGVKGEKTSKTPIQFVNRKGEPINSPQTTDLEGLILLDGTWSQSKALWWRNPWLLKLKRVILTPTQPSLYRELRKEPRRECLSTIECAAESLVALGESPDVKTQLTHPFEVLLNLHRKTRKRSR
ncbi:DTW domain-containing protein [bacterium]|jgi:DTW domain-containing protein YfiP|nr:DTW domain-containing protein [bacterium]